MDPSSLPTAEQEQDGYILVDLKHIVSPSNNTASGRTLHLIDIPLFLSLLPLSEYICISLSVFMIMQKPTFAPETHIDELGQFLQNCRDVPHLDLFSGDNTMNIHAAMVIIRFSLSSLFFNCLLKMCFSSLHITEAD